ncbi:hypothetical protein K1719_037220 [Acacia pycnantha]|nr:hypothetical protein K1719_037220 [Acacia pycnantha]
MTSPPVSAGGRGVGTPNTKGRSSQGRRQDSKKEQELGVELRGSVKALKMVMEGDDAIKRWSSLKSCNASILL